MLLRDLDALYDTLVDEDHLPPDGYEKKPVRFLVELDRDGHCLSILDTAPEKTQRYVPDIGRSGTNAVAFLVCDNAQYVLGLGKTDTAADREKAVRAHARYVDMLDDAIQNLEGIDPAAAATLRAVAAFVADPERARAEFTDRVAIAFTPDPKGVIAEASERIGFLVDGVDPTAATSVRRWWSQRATGKLVGETTGVCQISGQTGALARIMPGLAVKKGTPQALISANFASALRYNAVKSRGAQISVAAAIRSHQALNWLLDDRRHHRLIGQTTYVWWLQGDLAFDPFDLIARPDPADVAAMMARPWTGRPGLSPSDSFRVLGLTLTEGRIAIRFEHTSTLDAIEANTRRWLDLVAQHRHDGTAWWPSVTSLAEAATAPGTGAARAAQRDRAIEALTRAAITGNALPRSLLAALIGRCRAAPVPRTPANTLDWTALGSRLAALNLYRRFKEDTMNQHPSPGQICGRILAQLDNAQYQALGEINRTVADRYYAGASTRPQSVFPKLLSTAHAHLAKIGRSEGKGRAAQIAISRRLTELSGMLLQSGGFPATLSLEDQADFALAYWDEHGRRFRPQPSNDHDDSKSQEETQ
jgi:CRISPR-associated protein Csd1